IGLTYAFLVAGVLGAHGLAVALALDIVHAGARGYGYIESGWAVGAVAGGLAAGVVTRRRPRAVLVAALAILAVGHALLPYVAFLAAAVTMQALFGACRAAPLCGLSGRGRDHASAVRRVSRARRRAHAVFDHEPGAAPADGAHAVHLFGDLNAAAGEHELYARLAGAARGLARRLRCVGAAVQRRGSGRPARPGAHRKCLALTRRVGRDPG